jgi:hypothetical protein
MRHLKPVKNNNPEAMLPGIKKVFIFILLLSGFMNGFCISDNLQVSILTLEPGMEPYTIFGHTAIRIKDTTTHTDRIYNFGTFNFNTPHFYWKFLKGDLNYYLSTSGYKSYMRGSLRDQRKVWEQNLELEPGEKLKIYHELERCYQSEDRFYRYDFFHDNCATRVRDAIFNAMHNTVEYDTGLYCCKTFRQLMDPLFSVNYWFDLGINLVLGKEADKLAKSYDFMFLPVYIMEILQSAQRVSDKQLILDASVPGPDRNRFSYVLPWIIVTFLIVLSLPDRTRKIVFYTVLSVFGIMGLFLLFVSLISVNSGFRNNYNIAWMIPSLLVLFINNRKINDILKILYVASLIVMMLFRNSLPQELPLTFLPWILVLVFVLVMDLQWLKKGGFYFFHPKCSAR